MFKIQSKSDAVQRWCAAPNARGPVECRTYSRQKMCLLVHGHLSYVPKTLNRKTDYSNEAKGYKNWPAEFFFSSRHIELLRHQRFAERGFPRLRRTCSSTSITQMPPERKVCCSQWTNTGIYY